MLRMNASASIQNSGPPGRAGAPEGRQHVTAEMDVVAVGRRERGEVMGSGEQLGTLLHRPEVKRMGPVQGQATLVRTAGPAGEDAVAVRAAGRVTAGVESRRCRDALQHRDVVWQQRVERVAAGGLTGIAGHLPLRVNSGVGATGDRQPDRAPAQDDAQRTLQLVLDRPQTGLRRPAREVGPVVFDQSAGRPVHPDRPPPPPPRPGLGQTSSSSTISVESDRRGPSFRIRV